MKRWVPSNTIAEKKEHSDSAVEENGSGFISGLKDIRWRSWFKIFSRGLKDKISERVRRKGIVIVNSRLDKCIKWWMVDVETHLRTPFMEDTYYTDKYIHTYIHT